MRPLSINDLRAATKGRNWTVLDECPVCRSKSWRPIFAGRTQCILCKCDQCNTVFLNPRPLKADRTASGYKRGHGTKKYLPRLIQKKLISENLEPDLEKMYQRYRRLVDMTTLLEPQEPIVDVGCGIGLSILGLKHKNIPAIGYDVEDEFIEVARGIFGLNVHKVDVYDPNQKDRFAIATSNAVLEHIDEPVEFLVAIRENVLRPRGALVISVPNLHSLQFLEEGGDWDVINGGHVWYPTEQTMAEVAKRAGFHVETVYEEPPRQCRSHQEVYIREIIGFKGNLSGGLGMILRAPSAAPGADGPVDPVRAAETSS